MPLYWNAVLERTGRSKPAEVKLEMEGEHKLDLGPLIDRGV
jgi:hypothetical protein